MYRGLYTLLLVILATAIAGCSTEKFRSGNEVTIGSAETVAHDLYLAGARSTCSERLTATSWPRAASSI